jgi:hypothetical protein
MDKHKLGIIVPYRNRERHLDNFLNRINHFFKRKDIDYEVFVINQDNGKLFNRGMLLNIGFTFAKKSNCDYVVFHDVDMIPIDVDYGYSEIPLHLSTNFISDNNDKNREIFDEYFGGVTMFTVDDFIKINGYSNKYWGWGYEDNDLLLRCIKNNLPLDNLNIMNKTINGQFLKFNGVDSFVRVKNNINYNSDITLFISFNPNEIKFDHTKEFDQFNVFTIPGWDFSISYTSFLRYNFCIFDTEKNALYINSNIKPNYSTNFIVTINNSEKIIKAYQDGELIGSIMGYKKIYQYLKEEFFYLGVGEPNRMENQNYFNGYINKFAYFETILDDNEINEISNNSDLNLKQNSVNYKSSDKLKTYFDSNHVIDYKLIDLIDKNNFGEIVNCEIVELTSDRYKKIKIPYRRESLFKSLKHEENGFLNNKWKDQSTRWNQLRFHNEVLLNDDLLYNDGLSDLMFTKYGEHKFDNINIINVGL